ncbi:YjcG family protein [Neobacillus kokaensis]|uniref:Putative phosphoesterase AM1BK_19840 n=1 Tax=Neobacillus kokaensis TaxID=2759023 RepID=A0ABQ3N9Y3_9BACI|nr:YjcG family protein [Neobacillus kokaensis]GHH98441.1 putative phosphoesterase YjcG [Neobacillus kokaensis]
MKFGVVIFPSKNLQDFANSYRKRYDPHYDLIPPHLTLLNAFDATEEDAREFAERLQQISRNANPFTLKTAKISSFHPVNNAIYLKVEPVEELLKLHAEIKKEFSEHRSDYAFVPHITIGQKLSNDEHSDVYGALRMTKINHEEAIDRFHLLYQLENGSWTVYETFRLGKE